MTGALTSVIVSEYGELKNAGVWPGVNGKGIKICAAVLHAKHILWTFHHCSSCSAKGGSCIELIK